jgi:DNA-binding NarL/FixJ family response regulator
MSAFDRSGLDGLVLAIPQAWRAFLSSGEYAGARALVHASGSQVPVDVLARLEFVDERNLAIHVALVDDAPLVASAPGRGAVQLLTARERAVITLIAMGRETEDIAEALHVSPSTVRSHVRNSMSKLGAHTRAQLVAIAMEGQSALDITHTDDGTTGKSSN